MIRTLASYVINKIRPNNDDLINSNDSKLQNNGNQQETASNYDQNKKTECIDQISSLKSDTENIAFNGKISYAESVDSSFNTLFVVQKTNDDAEFTLHLPHMKWNAIENDKVTLTGIQNASGKIEFKNMEPKKKKDFEYGRVTAIEINYAVFDEKTVLIFKAIKNFPDLKMFDEYKYEAIESDQKCGTIYYDYRVVNLIEKVKSPEKGIEFSHNQFKIYTDDKVHSKYITIVNKSNRAVNLMSVKALAKDENHADLIEIEKEGSVINYNLNPKNGKFKVFIKIFPKKIGKFYFNLIADFKECQEIYTFDIDITKSYILPGQKYKKSPRFIDVRIDEYPVPKELREIDYNKIQEAKDELLKLYPELEEELTTDNYLTKMKVGIYLEEIALEKAFANYRIERGVFETLNDCLKLIVKDVAEKRPSITIGDKIIATDPFRGDEERPKYEGFVYKVQCDSILVKFHDNFHQSYNSTKIPNELPEFHRNHHEKEYTIDFFFSRSTFKRYHHALMKIFERRNLGINFLFPSKEIACKELQLNATLSETGYLLIDNQSKEWFNTELNKYQKSAVVNVLRGENRPLPYIFCGCPGSGKTRTVVETILQIYTSLKTSKIIIATPSNSAANLITEMLLQSRLFDRNNPPFLRIVSNNQVEKGLIPDNLNKFCGTISIATDDGSKNIAPTRNKQGILQNCTKSIIKEYRIIIGTLNCCGTLMQMELNGHFTHVIIDEAGQSIEPETIIPLTLMHSKKGQCVLAGDPKQLGPILVSRYGKIFNFNSSMLERLITTHPYYAKKYGPNNDDYDPSFITKLIINYRSIPSVMKLYNDLFYNGELESAVDEEKSPEALLLAEKTQNILWPYTNRKCGIHFVNVENGRNKRVIDSCSWYNDYEIKKIISFLSKCTTANIPFKDIGIVTPYALQVKKLIEQINLELNDTDLKIGTVEEFQGQEKMIIIVSTVRTNQTHMSTDAKFGLGFIQCSKRMNVCISRARALLVIFGKETILQIDPSWKQLIDYTKQNNSYVVEK